MRLPQVATRNKIRDYKICRMYVVDYMTMEEIASNFDITTSRIQQILYRNRHLLNLDRNYEKIKRINWLKRQIKKRGDSERDSADLLTQLRAELEGEKGVEVKNIINVGTNGKLTDQDREWQGQVRDRLHKRYEV